MSLASRLLGVGETLLHPAAAFSPAFRQREALADDAHRPWPLPVRPWFMGQVWERLLFAHWRVEPEDLERVIPAELALDRFDDECWIGVTPFVVRGLRLRGSPPVPFVSRFPEINVRTYVTVGGKAGIYFLSLDADSRLAVMSARREYRLPYFKMTSSVDATAAGTIYRARRTSSDGPAAAFGATCAPRGPARPPRPGTLEHWLTERYCLYTLDESRRVLRGEIHHPPWPLQSAEAQIEVNSMTAGYGLALEGEPLLHFSARQEVALWRLAAA